MVIFYGQKQDFDLIVCKSVNDKGINQDFNEEITKATQKFSKNVNDVLIDIKECQGDIDVLFDLLRPILMEKNIHNL